MKRYVFSYEVISTKQKSEFGVVAGDEEQAREQILERVADIEFTSENDIIIDELVRIEDDRDNYYECEACT